MEVWVSRERDEVQYQEMKFKSEYLRYRIRGWKGSNWKDSASKGTKWTEGQNSTYAVNLTGQNSTYALNGSRKDWLTLTGEFLWVVLERLTGEFRWNHKPVRCPLSMAFIYFLLSGTLPWYTELQIRSLSRSWLSIYRSSWLSLYRSWNTLFFTTLVLISHSALICCATTRPLYAVLCFHLSLSREGLQTEL